MKLKKLQKPRNDIQYIISPETREKRHPIITYGGSILHQSRGIGKKFGQIHKIGKTVKM